MARNGDTLERRRETLLAALLTLPSVEAAAKHAGLGLTTAYRYLREPDFQEAFRQAKRSALDQAIAHLQVIATEAVAVLRAVMNDPETPASARVTAARAVLDTAVKAHEVEDLAQRVSELEQLIENQPKGRLG